MRVRQIIYTITKQMQMQMKYEENIKPMWWQKVSEKDFTAHNTICEILRAENHIFI